MKKYLILIVLMQLCCILPAQRYYIYKCSEGVMVKHRNSAEWKQGEKRESLSLLDMVRVPENANVVVLDINSNRLYKKVTAGEMNVKNIIDEARKNTNGIVRLLNSEIKQDNAGSDGNSYSSYGAVVRGDEDEMNKLHRVLCDALVAATKKKDFSSNDKLNISMVEVMEDEIAFEFCNETDNTLYVNILRVDFNTSKMSLCYTFEQDENIEGCMIAANSKTLIGDYIFARDTEENIVYIPFATMFPYDSKLLQLQLQNYNDNLSDVDCDKNIIIGKGISTLNN